MKIRIEKEGQCFTLPVPTSLILKGLTGRITENIIEEIPHVHLTREQLRNLAKEIKQAKKAFPGLTLVDVKSAGNERVTITL